MLTLAQARAHLVAHLNQQCPLEGDVIDIRDDRTVERPYGWVFMYDCRKFIETKDPEFARLVGNVPIVVNRKSGTFTYIAWHGTLEESIRQYEEGPDGPRGGSFGNYLRRWLGV